MNPFSGENPPFISSSRSQSWRPVRSHEGQSFDCAFNSDRKSTRLNSSHSQISYAVFCLKKKNAPLPSNLIHCLPAISGPLDTAWEFLTEWPAHRLIVVVIDSPFRGAALRGSPQLAQPLR